MMNQKMCGRLLVALMLSSGFFITEPARVVAANAADLLIALKPSLAFPKAKGTAKYRNRGGKQTLQVEVENLKSVNGQQLQVNIDGAPAGVIVVSPLGKGTLSLSSALHQVVPPVTAASKISVRTATDLVVVAN